jgi:hypothetical protein
MIAESAEKTTSHFESMIAYGISALTVLTFALAVATPPLSGPLCREPNCVTYPYSAVASRFPRDYLWMYPAIVLSLAYVVLVVLLYFRAPASKRIPGLLGVIAASMSGLVLAGDYFLQLSVVPPSVRLGEVEGVALLTQYNAHGVFIVLEELGYLLMAVSFLCVAPTVVGVSRLERSLRTVLKGGCTLGLLAFGAIGIGYGIQREYRFELAIISIDWLVLAVAAFMTGQLWRRERPASAGAHG